MTIELQFLVLDILRREIHRGAQTHVWKASTVAQRKAIEREYDRKLAIILRNIENDDIYNSRWPNET